mmetsp:Transcript_21131/g.46096  ORF Transcript_21131/g.46096 Transcript_21131/m.46096 type:complete len:204 (+) Transcript_21131:1583-2194(+)
MVPSLLSMIPIPIPPLLVPPPSELLPLLFAAFAFEFAVAFASSRRFSNPTRFSIRTSDPFLLDRAQHSITRRVHSGVAFDTLGNDEFSIRSSIASARLVATADREFDHALNTWENETASITTGVVVAASAVVVASRFLAFLAWWSKNACARSALPFSAHVSSTRLQESVSHSIPAWSVAYRSKSWSLLALGGRKPRHAVNTRL